MKIKNLDVGTTDFWYDISKGGYLKPDELCEDPIDAERVKSAIETIEEFEQSCMDQIDGFYM